MLVMRSSLVVLSLASALGTVGLLSGGAEAKGRCASGQILRVSTGACISREAAIEQGIIGGRHKAQPAAIKDEPETETATSAEPDNTAAEASEPEKTPAAPPKAPRKQARQPRQQQASNEQPPKASPAGVRIEVVRTERRPTPEILTPTWPYGELAAFPRRVNP